MVVLAILKRKVMREIRPYRVVWRKHVDKHNLEKLCEKQKQRHSSMISLLRPIEEIL